MNLYYELNLIKDKLPKQTYKTILGQLRAGDYVGAEKGMQTALKKYTA